MKSNQTFIDPGIHISKLRKNVHYKDQNYLKNKKGKVNREEDTQEHELAGPSIRGFERRNK